MYMFHIQLHVNFKALNFVLKVTLLHRQQRHVKAS